jgi:hypothetical protein
MSNKDYHSRFNPVQQENALVAIRVSFESDPNINDARDEQERKHSLPRISTEDGIRMDGKLVQQENA